MSPTDINKKRKKIYEYIDRKQLKSAIDNVKDLVAEQQNWSLNERLTELETNYKYMLHYLVEGKGDPEQEKIYDKLFRDIYIITDDAAESLLIRESSLTFFEKLRLQKLQKVTTIDEYREIISKQADTFTFLDLLEDGEEKDTKTKSNAIAHEKSVRDLFYLIYTSPRASSDFITSLNRFINDEIIPIQDKCMVISALTLNIIQRFDSSKILYMLDVCRNSNNDIVTRAVIGIIPIFQIYRKRLKLYPECSNRLKLLSDNNHFNHTFMNAVIGYIQAHETEKITRRLNEEIIPEMMRLSPMIGKKIKLDEWISESGLDEKNPEWQKILDDSGLTDKLLEFSELQMKGADVFHSTFSNLKSYPFFLELSNWFLPFNPQHSSVKKIFTDSGEGNKMINGIFDSSIICNSDKYSVCFSIMMMPEQYRNMMINQFGADGDDIKRLQEEELSLNPNQKEESNIKQYIQDLYRFFKLHPKSSDFIDIFNLPLNFHKIEEFYPIVFQPINLEKIALYYLEKNNFPEAYSTYKILADKVQPKSEFWQKMGYCKQMIGDINGALESYLHADLIEENNTWVLNRIAHCYRVLKKPDTALEYYRRLEQFHPDDLNIQLNIGHCYLELKQYEEALNFYFKVELLNSNNTRAWRSIAWCAFLSRKFDVSQKYYLRIIENKPNAHDYLNSGHVELCLGNNLNAVKMYIMSQKETGSLDAFSSLFADDMNELVEAGINPNIIPIIIDKIRYELE